MTDDIKHIIESMKVPIHNLSLSQVIEALSGYKVLPFDKNDPRDRRVLEVLCTVAQEVVKEVNQEGIKRPRPNEVGNDIEVYVKDVLTKEGYNADVPRALNGTKKATGYPDIEFVDEFGRIHYLECKTYNIKNISTTQRSFYLSPSENFKVTDDAHHFVLSFEIYVSHREGTNNIYKCRHWKIVDVSDLQLDVKYEFNSDNQRLYDASLVLSSD